MIIYLGYFILNEKHKDGGSPSSVTAYYNSIIQHIKKFIENNKMLLLFLDSSTNKQILNIMNIEIPNNIIILNLEYEETYMYKTYYNKFKEQILNNEIILAPFYNCKQDLEKDSSLTTEERITRHTNLLKTLLIWNTKFELFNKAKNYILDNNLDFSHICYLDVGIWRTDRIRFIKYFHEANFNIHTLNKININFDPKLFNLPINYKNLLYKGHYEVAANHICLSILIIDDFFEKFKKTFVDINNKYKFITTEQRYLRLILPQYNVKDITCYRNQKNCSYTIDFHNPPIDY
tara:strand:+ start:597 stop:1469 length:873 start_codon:yes stop_codon:yes gene_type:complete